jgi:uncharacterized protein
MNEVVMKVLITGATGFIGSKLVHALCAKNFDVVAPVRDVERAKKKFPTQVQCVLWPDAEAPLPKESVTGVEAVIHLLGESIADSRWTKSRKKALHDSRIKSTERLFERFTEQQPRSLKLFISASAIGFYGDRQDEILTEDSSGATDFLGTLVRDWENAAKMFSQIGARVVCIRTGIVIGADGGAMKKLLPMFRRGLGGTLGSGRQWMSWIHIDDLINVYISALTNSEMNGPINAVSPKPMRNSDFTRTLADALGKPAMVPVPALALRLALGELADVLLGGALVMPAKLQASAFHFSHSDLGESLKDLFS